MKTILFSFFLLFILISSASYASGVITCSNTVEGEELGGKFETKASFSSADPSLSDEITITLTGQTPKITRNSYLNQKMVCGLVVDFNKDCKTQQSFDAKLGYQFSFNCGSDITSAVIYCDENCLTDAGSLMTFKCEGPKVEKKLSEGGLVYQGCKVSYTP